MEKKTKKILAVSIVTVIVILSIVIYIAFSFISGFLSGAVIGIWSDGYNYIEFRENETFAKWYSNSENYEIVGKYELGVLSGSLTLSYTISDNGTEIPKQEKFTIEIITTDRSLVGGEKETVMELRQDLDSGGIFQHYSIIELTYFGRVGSYDFTSI
jgi:hypothetical protein